VSHWASPSLGTKHWCNDWSNMRVKKLPGETIILSLDLQEAADLVTALESYARFLRNKWGRDGILLCHRCLEICEQVADLLRAAGVEPAGHEG